jgi:hypothetical protein
MRAPGAAPLAAGSSSCGIQGADRIGVSSLVLPHLTWVLLCALVLSYRNFWRRDRAGVPQDERPFSF